MKVVCAVVKIMEAQANLTLFTSEQAGEQAVWMVSLHQHVFYNVVGFVVITVTNTSSCLHLALPPDTAISSCTCINSGNPHSNPERDTGDTHLPPFHGGGDKHREVYRLQSWYVPVLAFHSDR